jgi:hypothetical protein
VTEPFRDGNARDETGSISPAIRALVFERDGGYCRVCGGMPESPALHHIRYRSEGGLNVVENLITVHWMYAPRCHELVHGNKRLWQPILLEVVKHGGVTALQYKRWAERRRKA